MLSSLVEFSAIKEKRERHEKGEPPEQVKNVPKFITMKAFGGAVNYTCKKLYF